MLPSVFPLWISGPLLFDVVATFEIAVVAVVEVVVESVEEVISFFPFDLFLRLRVFNAFLACFFSNLAIFFAAPWFNSVDFFGAFSFIKYSELPSSSSSEKFTISSVRE